MDSFVVRTSLTSTMSRKLWKRASLHSTTLHSVFSFNNPNTKGSLEPSDVCNDVFDHPEKIDEDFCGNISSHSRFYTCVVPNIFGISRQISSGFYCNGVIGCLNMGDECELKCRRIRPENNRKLFANSSANFDGTNSYGYVSHPWIFKCQSQDKFILFIYIFKIHKKMWLNKGLGI